MEEFLGNRPKKDGPKENKGDYNPEQLSMGTEVEREHKPTLDKIDADIARNSRRTMTDDEFYRSIAQDHLDELPNVYYTLLKELEETGKKMEAENKQS